MKRIMQFAVIILILSVTMGQFQIGSVQGSTSQPLTKLSAGGPDGTVTLGAWRNTRPTESFLRGISMLPADASVDCIHDDQQSKGWIVGDNVILGYCNGIWDQYIFPQSIGINIYGVAAVTPTLALAVGSDGTILMYNWNSITSTNYSWVKHPINGINRYLYRIVVVNNGVLYNQPRYTAWVVGEKDTTSNKPIIVKGDIYAMHDSSNNAYLDPYGHPIYQTDWKDLTTSTNLPSINALFGIYAVSNNDIWTVGGKEGLGIAAHWNGSSWTATTLGDNPYWGVFFSASNDGWAVGVGGHIQHYDGIRWTEVASPVTADLIHVAFSANGTGWATGLNGTLLKYVNGRWTRIADLRTDFWDYYALDFNSGHGWMLAQNPYKKPQHALESEGVGGQILEYSDSDQAWLAVTSPTDNQLNDVKTLSDTNAWAVGSYDSAGATIIHWDGKHWQRWYQNDPPLPKATLTTIDMISATDGWAAGEPPNPAAPALMLHWDGRRWAPVRYKSPINVRISSLRLTKVTDPIFNFPDFGWAVGVSGDQIAKYDYMNGFWSGDAIYGGTGFNLRGLSLDCYDVNCKANELAAWAVGRQTNLPGPEWFLKYQQVGKSWFWVPEQTPNSQFECLVPIPDQIPPDDGAYNTNLFGVRVKQNSDRSEWGFASGDYKGRATIYQYDGNYWDISYCDLPESTGNPYLPSRFYSTDIIPGSGIVWFGGFYTDWVTTTNRWPVAYIAYEDSNTVQQYNGHGWGGDPFPVDGFNIYHRPVTSIDMSSDTMGWAVGENQDTSNVGVLYQYPYPNFTLMASPERTAAQPGHQASYTLNVNSIAAGNMNVDLAVDISDLPRNNEIGISLSRSVIDPSQTATLTLTFPADYPQGNYETSIVVSGSAIISSGDVNIPVVRYAHLSVWVTDHLITDVQPKDKDGNPSGPANTEVTITGINLGEDPGPGNRSSDENYVVVAGAKLPESSVLSWSPTQIVILLPDDISVFEKGPVKDVVQVFNQGVPSNDNFDFQLENLITGVTITPQGNGTKLISVTGTSFGEDPGTNLHSTQFEHVTIDGLLVDEVQIVSWNNNLIEFTAPTTPSLNQKGLIITSNGYDSNTFSITDTTPDPGSDGKTAYLPMVVR